MPDPARPGPATVVVQDEQYAVPIDRERWRLLAVQVLAEEGVLGTEANLVFVDEATIAELKQEHLGGDGGPTDVLSFPMDDPREHHDPSAPSLLGDVLICPRVAARQAPEHAGSFDDEVALLLVHGLLHLLGHDHAEDDERALMHERERALLEQLYGSLAADPWLADAEHHR